MSKVITPTNAVTPSSYYRLWVPGVQSAGSGDPADRSGKNNSLTRASTISAIPTWTALSGTLTTGQRCIPTTDNGYVYELTTGGAAKGGAEPTWPTVVGNTVADSGMTWTCRRGVWSAAGYFRSLLSQQSTSLNNAESGFTVAANQTVAYTLGTATGVGDWDLAAGNSFILSVRLRQNYSGNTENFLMGNRASGAAGWSLVAVPATGAPTFRTLRFRLSNRVVQTFTTDYPTATFETLDGNEHHFCVMVDGVTGLLYGWVDGSIVNAVSSGTVTMNGANVRSVLSTTTSPTFNATPQAFQIGIQPGTTNSSIGYQMRDLHMLVIPSGGLPANYVQIMNLLRSRPFVPLSASDLGA